MNIVPQFHVGPVICGLCGWPVERVTFWRDDSTNELVMVAHCHGSKDERRIPDDPGSLEDAVKLQRALEEGGTAFDQTPLITTGEDHVQQEK